MNRIERCPFRVRTAADFKSDSLPETTQTFEPCLREARPAFDVVEYSPKLTEHEQHMAVMAGAAVPEHGPGRETCLRLRPKKQG